MSTINRRDLMATGASLLPLLGLASVASGQEPFTPPPRTPRGNGEKIGTGTGIQSHDAVGVNPSNPKLAVLKSQDPTMAACLLLAGHKQIQVCTFALDQIQDKAVKAFAHAEIDEHETLKKRFQDIGYQFPRIQAPPEPEIGRAADVVAGSRTNDTGTTKGIAVRARPILAIGRTVLPQAAADIVALEAEITEQCIASNRSEMRKLAGPAFDRRFVGSQLDAHYVLLDRSVIYRKHATDDLSPILDMAKPVIEQHIAALKKLMDRLSI